MAYYAVLYRLYCKNTHVPLACPATVPVSDDLSRESCHFLRLCGRAFIVGTCVGINNIHSSTPFSIDILVNNTPAVVLEYYH